MGTPSNWPINNEVLAEVMRSVREGKPLSMDDQKWLAEAAGTLSNALDETLDAVEDARAERDEARARLEAALTE